MKKPIKKEPRRVVSFKVLYPYCANVAEYYGRTKSKLKHLIYERDGIYREKKKSMVVIIRVILVLNRERASFVIVFT